MKSAVYYSRPLQVFFCFLFLFAPSFITIITKTPDRHENCKSAIFHTAGFIITYSHSTVDYNAGRHYVHYWALEENMVEPVVGVEESIYLSIYISIYVYIAIFISIYISIFPSIYLYTSMFLSIYLRYWGRTW